MYIIISFSSLS